MLITTKLRIHLILAIIALILKIVIFSSPGWAIFKFPVDGYYEKPFGDDMVFPEDGDGTPAPERRPPVAMAKREVRNSQDAMPKRFPSEYRKERSVMSVQIGLWYFVTCIHECRKDDYEKKDFVIDDDMGKMKHKEDDDDDDDDHHRKRHCVISTYERARHNAYKLSREMQPARNVYTNIGYAAKLGLLEFRIETVTGLLLSIIGVIFTGLYKKSFAEKRCHGLAACLTLLPSGVLYAVAVGKAMSAICQARAVFEMNNWETHRMPIPWCLILGAIAAALTLVVAVCHIFTLSRERKDPNNCYVIKTHHVKGSFPFHTLAPPGYEPKLSLLNPPEEAGPLPEKPAI